MFRCIITGPTVNQIHDSVDTVSGQTAIGEVEVMTGHAEAFFIFVPGVITLASSKNGPQNITTQGALCYVAPDEVRIILQN